MNDDIRAILNKRLPTILPQLSKHFVFLHWASRPQSNESPHRIGSGFVALAGDMCYFVTAGHVLKRLDDEIKRGVALGASLSDAFATEEELHHKEGGFDLSIPVGKDTPFFFAEDENSIDVPDIGAFPLHSLQFMPLSNGGVEFVDTQIDLPSERDPDFFCVVGMPACFAKVKSSIKKNAVNTNVDVACVLVPLKLGDISQSVETGVLKFDLDFETSSDNFDFDASGLSGSPIFAVYTDSQKFSYRIVGVQHGQKGSTLYVTPIRGLLNQLTTAFRLARSKSDAHAPHRSHQA